MFKCLLFYTQVMFKRFELKFKGSEHKFKTFELKFKSLKLYIKSDWEKNEESKLKISYFPHLD